MASRPDAQNPLAILYASHMLKRWGYDPAQFEDPTAAWRQLSAQLASQGAFTPHPQAYAVAFPDGVSSQPDSPGAMLAQIVAAAKSVPTTERYPGAQRPVDSGHPFPPPNAGSTAPMPVDVSPHPFRYPS